MPSRLAASARESCSKCRRASTSRSSGSRRSSASWSRSFRRPSSPPRSAGPPSRAGGRRAWRTTPPHRPAYSDTSRPGSRPGCRGAAVDPPEPVAREQPQPQEQRHLRLAEVVRELGHRFQVRFLEHVGRVHAALEPVVEPQGDHPPEAVVVVGQERGPGGVVAGRGRPEPVPGFVSSSRGGPSAAIQICDPSEAPAGQQFSEIGFRRIRVSGLVAAGHLISGSVSPTHRPP